MFCLHICESCACEVPQRPGEGVKSPGKWNLDPLYKSAQPFHLGAETRNEKHHWKRLIKPLQNKLNHSLTEVGLLCMSLLDGSMSSTRSPCFLQQFGGPQGSWCAGHGCCRSRVPHANDTFLFPAVKPWAWLRLPELPPQLQRLTPPEPLLRYETS